MRKKYWCVWCLKFNQDAEKKSHETESCLEIKIKIKACEELESQQRLLSLDVFRGLNMLIMIFANAVNEKSFRVEGIPDWFRHASKADTMTFPDVIWPAFAFIMGVSIPLAVKKRVTKGDSYLHIWMSVLIRSASMMIIGITMFHAWIGVGKPFFMSISLWSVLLFVAFFLIWSQHRSTDSSGMIFRLSTKILGIILLIFLAAIYRGEDGLSWMRLEWWILGSLGWGYLTGSVIYLLLRKYTAGIVGLLALLILLCVGDREGVFSQIRFFGILKQYIPLGGIGVWGSITVSGVIVGALFTDDSPSKTAAGRIYWMLLFAAGLFVAGFFLRPLYGLGKGAATPTWILYSTSISCLIFVFLYWFIDVANIRWWTGFISPAGRNPLLPYFLSRMMHPLFIVLSLESVNTFLNTGYIGVLKIFMLSLLLILFTGMLVKHRLILLKL